MTEFEWVMSLFKKVHVEQKRCWTEINGCCCFVVDEEYFNSLEILQAECNLCDMWVSFMRGIEKHFDSKWGVSTKRVKNMMKNDLWYPEYGLDNEAFTKGALHNLKWLFHSEDKKIKQEMQKQLYAMKERMLIEIQMRHWLPKIIYREIINRMCVMDNVFRDQKIQHDGMMFACKKKVGA